MVAAPRVDSDVARRVLGAGGHQALRVRLPVAVVGALAGVPEIGDPAPSQNPEGAAVLIELTEEIESALFSFVEFPFIPIYRFPG